MLGPDRGVVFYVLLIKGERQIEVLCTVDYKIEVLLIRLWTCTAFYVLFIIKGERLG